MHFENPQYFHLLWIVPLMALFMWLVGRRKDRLLAGFASASLLGRLADPLRPGVGFLRSVMLLTALSLLVVCLARPQYGRQPVILKREGRDIVFLLDTSLSMLADDIKPDRLTRARFELNSLLGRLEGDRVALVPFAGDAFVLCPLTTDYAAVSMFVDGIDTGMISEPGTNIARALKAGGAAFDEQESKYRVMVLITDGEQLEGDALQMAGELRKAGIHLYAIGIGTPEGVPIPIKDAQGKVGDYKRDSRGEIVMSRLGEQLLADLAHTGGGEYYRAGTQALELDRIFEDIKKLEKRQIDSREFVLYHDRYQWFLSLAFVLLLVEPLLLEVRRRRQTVNKSAGASA
jgi:Ca-activated chloride channel homolog